MPANFQVAFGKSLLLFVPVYVFLAHWFAPSRQALSIMANIHILHNQMCIVSLPLSTLRLPSENKLFRWSKMKHGTHDCLCWNRNESSRRKTGTKYLLQTMKWYEPRQAKATRNITNPWDTTKKTCSIWCYALTHNSALNGSGLIFLRSIFFSSMHSSVLDICHRKRVKNYQQ